MNKIEELSILETIKHSPENGFKKLMLRFKEPIYWHIRRLVVLHDDAQDASQETFIRIFRSINQFKAEASLSTWIYKIATHEALRLLDKQKEERLAPEDQSAGEARLMSDEYVDYSDLEAVKLQQAIQSLPTKQKIVFTLRYYDELDYEDIAKVAECSPASAKANYHTAKEKVIKYMNNHD